MSQHNLVTKLRLVTCISPSSAWPLGIAVEAELRILASPSRAWERGHAVRCPNIFLSHIFLLQAFLHLDHAAAERKHLHVPRPPHRLAHQGVGSLVVEEPLCGRVEP